MDKNQITVLSSNDTKLVQDQGLDFNLSAFNIKELVQKSFQVKALYLFVQEGEIRLKTEYLDCNLKAGMYLALSGNVEVEFMPNSRGIYIETSAFHPLNCVGGPLENEGRLQYIDGCSDTLLLPPSRLGEPCLNLLHFPSKTNQTIHHHPSFRFGIVYSGCGESVSLSETIDLRAGDVFFIPAGVQHKFNTNESEMNVIAFHPDSDWGPTDEIHPMKNRTWFK